MSDLRDSGEIEQDADAIIFPWRQPLEDSEGPPIQYVPEPTKLIIAKNRHGAAGLELDVMWDGRYFSFYDVDTYAEEPGGAWIQ